MVHGAFTGDGRRGGGLECRARRRPRLRIDYSTPLYPMKFSASRVVGYRD